VNIEIENAIASARYANRYLVIEFNTGKDCQESFYQVNEGLGCPHARKGMASNGLCAN
jgi:hypothetical protein